MSDKDLLTIIRDMIKWLSDINGQISILNESIKKLPDAATLKSIESSILLESQKQHNDLACSDDIARLETKLDVIVSELRARLDHIEHDHLPSVSSSQTSVDLVKAVLDTSVEAKKLENERASTSEENKLREKKLDSKLERLKGWLKFWPLFIAALFEIVRWAWPHIQELIKTIRG